VKGITAANVTKALKLKKRKGESDIERLWRWIRA